MRRTRAAVVLGAVLALLLPASTGALERSGEVQSELALHAYLAGKHPKLDSALARLAGVRQERGRLVPVEAVARGGGLNELEAAIRAAGGTTTGRYRGLIEARLPVRALESLAVHPAVRVLRSPTRPHAQVVSGQGIAASGAAAWHSAQTAGAGVEIAVVDLGFAGWQERQTEGELPAEVVTADFCDAGSFAGPAAESHGTAVAEIVHELAPAAKLHLVCIDTLTSLGEAKDYVVTNDIPIVNHSVGWLNVSRGDGTGGPGTPDGIVADARAQGVLWVNAAGNYGQVHWSGAFSDPDSDGVHNFYGADQGNEVLLYTDGVACVYLKWDDWPTTDQDFDLLLFRSSDNQLIAFSAFVQNGSQEPVEGLCYEDPGGSADDYYLIIVSDGATESPRFDLFVTEGQDLEYSSPGGSLIEPATSPAALAVGAVCWQSGELETYSSRGPTIDGRVKPDVSGPDAVSTVTYAETPNCAAGFGGTSASTAHVTGAAALLKQANPMFGPAELQAALEGKTVDLFPTGKDNNSGSGRLALGSPPPTPPSAPASAGVPTITGLFHQGQTLSASDGEWTSGEALFFAFRWLRCDDNGGTCGLIAGARNRTYVPTSADVGRRLRVRVSASNTGGSTQAVSDETPQIRPPVQPTLNVIAPTLAGMAQFGQVVSASSGAWSGTAPLTIILEWLRCSPAGDACAVIAGAAAATYRLALEDIGFTIRVRATATNAAGSTSATSEPSRVVSPPPPGLVSAPMITGNAQPGLPLTTTSGTWTFATALAIQWRRCTADGVTCSDIPGATDATYTTTQADVGFRLRVVVVASNVAGGSSATSDYSAVVQPHLDQRVEAQIKLIVLGFSRKPTTPQAGRRFTVSLRIGMRVTNSLGATRRVSCPATLARRSLRAAAKSIRGEVARCVWTIPKSAAGKRLRSTIVVSEGARSVQRTVTTTVRAPRLR